MTEVKIAVALSIVVFVLNVLPAFAPPTWTTMSFIGLAIPNNNSMLLSLVAATAATAGRIVLAKLSRGLMRRRMLSEEARRNIDNIRFGIESRPALTFGTFLAYALSPLPSNYLFTAHCLPVDTLLRRTPGELHILGKGSINNCRLVRRGCGLVWIGALFHCLLSYLSAAVNSVHLHFHQA